MNGMHSENFNLNVDITPELDALLTELSKETGNTKSQVLRNALVLMDIAVDAVRSGGTVTVNEALSPGGPLFPKEIVGLMSGSAHGTSKVVGTLTATAKG